MSHGAFSKDKLIFDPSAASDSDNIGSYTLAGDDGTQIGHVADSLKVNITNFSAEIAVFAEDTAHTTGDLGKFILAVRRDADTSMVSTDGDYAPLQVNASGRLKVDAELDVDFDYVYAEDSAHVTAALGAYVLAVRQDTLVASVDTDGDYGSFKFDARGAQWVAPVGTAADDAVDTENPVKIGSRVQAGPLTAVSAAGDRANVISDLYRRIYVNNSPNIAILSTQQDVDNTAAIAIPTAALGGRKTVMIQNLSNKEIYLGATGVTAADGFVIAARATISLDLGPNVSPFIRGSVVTAQDLRILELA